MLTVATAHAQPEGAVRIQLALERLRVLGSVLMIGAHPDDENTALLAWCAHGRHLRTGYLSATRGEGGQNLIGAEQGDALGVIRTQELLAARRIDGAEQFFTRAIDFGFSKSPRESIEKWGREQILSDMVWVIRRYRPDVIVFRFSGTPRDGHGHHQASAILGREAMAAAADNTRFPEHLRRAEVWQTHRAMFNMFAFTPEQEKEIAAVPEKFTIDSGEYSPVLGKSYSEIAGLSRSLHASQAFGSAQRRGPQPNYLVTVAGPPPQRDLLDGIDTTWRRVPGGEEIGRILDRAAREFRPEHPDRILPLLLEARGRMAEIHHHWTALKLREIDETVAFCAGLWLDAAAERPQVNPGQSIKVRLTAVNRSALEISGSAELAGRTVSLGELPANRPVTSETAVPIPEDTPWSAPFWLREPRHGEAYVVAGPDLIGRADPPPVLEARFRLAAGGQTIEITRPVEYRYVDPARGELTRPLAIVPPVAVSAAGPVMLFRPGGRMVTVRLRASAPAVRGTVRLEVPAGWRVRPESLPFEIAEIGGRLEFSFEVTPPSGEARARIRPVADVGGRKIDAGIQVIAYPHIPQQTLFPAATITALNLDVKTHARRCGYLMGAGDEVPQALRELGCEVTLLQPSDLDRRDVDGFDAIVLGVRAYNVHADLRPARARLLDYVNRGGTLVTQYNVLEPGFPEIGPWPISIGRERVSVEEAPVSFPDPKHPVLNNPNRITAADFEGWVQERGLYFAAKWDPRYQPLFESHDPGEPPRPGGTLFARYGKGVFIFTAYSWFRQLPAAVPGAYRIFANLISAK